MKTTVDIQDELLDRAKLHAKQTGRSLQALVEDRLRRVLSTAPYYADEGYRLPDCSVGDGDSRGPDPIAQYSWPELRAMIYGEESQDWTPLILISWFMPTAENRKRIKQRRQYYAL